METFAAGFQHLVLHLFGWMLPAALLMWICAVLGSHGLNPFSALKRFLAPIPPVGRAVFGVLLVGLVVYGSTKSGGDTNSPPSRLSAPRRMPRLADAVTSNDVARGWRAVAFPGTETPVEMPAGAVTNDLLRRRGGCDWAFRVEPDGWRFPYRDGALTGVTVLVRGEVRPDVGTPYFPVPVTNGVSLLPEARWGLLPDGGASVFSHAVTANGSLLLDWRNALVGRDANCPTNLQMELFRDGCFAWRTDGGSTSYLPVLPFDWDNDGLENSVDPEPLAPNPVDAHGTPAEWYRIVCSNVFTTADNSNNQTFPNSDIQTFPNSDISFRTNANPRAYYFVDVVASEGPAPIHFNADRGSRLGSPVVVARAGETNRVPLLVGVGYAVTSAVPFSVAPLEGSFAEVDRRDARSCAIRWPLDFMVTESDDGHTVTVTPVPYDPGGIYVWNDQNDASRAVAGLLSARPSDCPYVANGGCLMFGCGGGYCTCGGCWRSGSLMLDGASFRLPTIWCGCGDDGPEDPEPTPVPHRDMASRPAVSVSFSHPVVLFENAYTNAPGEIVQRQSTETTLTISAYGGANGAFLEVDPGMLEERLERREGHRLPPTRVKIPANSDVVYSVTYQGRAASERKGDVEVTAALTAVNEMSPMPSTAEMTAVQVAIIPERPMGDLYRNRHRFGICEKVWCNIDPADLIVSWSSGQQGSMAVDGHYFKHHVPFAAQSYELTAEIEGVRLSCPVSSIFPSGVSAFNDPNYEIYAIVNQAAIDDAGWVGATRLLCSTNEVVDDFMPRSRPAGGL